MTFKNYLFKMSDKVEISSFFWKLSCITWCFSGNCLLRWCSAEAKPWEGVLCFAGTDAFRGCMMSGESINGTPQTMRGRSCITTLCNALLSSLLCNTSCFFNGLHSVERNWYPGWFHWLVMLWQGLVVSAGSSHGYWLVFSVSYWTGLMVSW